MFDLSEIDITTSWHRLYGLWQKVTYWVKNVVNLPPAYKSTKNLSTKKGSILTVTSFNYLSLPVVNSTPHVSSVCGNTRDADE